MTCAHTQSIKGFTLIELIIVLSIVGLLLTVVAPVSMYTLEKSEAKTELLETKQWFKHISYQAYIESQGYQLHLSDHQARLFKQSDLAQPIRQKTFKSLRFTDQNITINTKGIVFPSIIEGFYGEKTWQVDLSEPQLAGVTDEK